MSQVSAALWLLHAAIFTTGLENPISRASFCPLSLAASGKSFLSPGVCYLQHCTLFTITNVPNEYRKLRRDTHQYTKTHLQFLAPCSPLHSPIHTELNIQAIYPWCCNFSLPPCWFCWKKKVALQQQELKGAEFDFFQSLSNSILTGEWNWLKVQIITGTGYTKMSCKVITIQYQDDTDTRTERQCWIC